MTTVAGKARLRVGIPGMGWRAQVAGLSGRAERKEATEQLLQLIELCLVWVMEEACKFAAPKDGGKILGSVPGRSLIEDQETKMDDVCEDIVGSMVRGFQRATRLRVRVFSEHGTYGSRDPQLYCSVDPFDGSGLQRRGLRREWYSVLSFFDLEGNPVVGGAADIRSREIFLASRGEVTKISLWDGSRIPVSPVRRTEIDSETVLAAYLMNREYRNAWHERAANLFHEFQGLLWCNGGSCIYPSMAAGEIHAYVMFDEPRSEIDPGLAFAMAARFPVFSVTERGLLVPYRFEPGRQKDRVPFFITACTRELAQAVVKEILR